MADDGGDPRDPLGALTPEERRSVLGALAQGGADGAEVQAALAARLARPRPASRRRAQAGPR